MKAKLTRGHNKEKVDIEEKQVNALIKSLTKEQIQDLETPIFLVAASSGPAGSEQPRIQVPKKIRLMCKLIDDLLKADETRQEV